MDHIAVIHIPSVELDPSYDLDVVVNIHGVKDSGALRKLISDVEVLRHELLAGQETSVDLSVFQRIEQSVQAAGVFLLVHIGHIDFLPLQDLVDQSQGHRIIHISGEQLFQLVVPDIVIILGEVDQENIPIVGAVLHIKAAEMGHKPLPGEVNSFPLHTGSVVVNEKPLDGRGDNLVTKDVLHDPVRELFSRDPTLVAPFIQQEASPGEKFVKSQPQIPLHFPKVEKIEHFKLLNLGLPITPFLCSNESVVQRITIKYFTLITGTIVIGGVVFGIYHHSGRTISPFSVRGNGQKPHFFIPGSEIGADAVRVTGVVVVRIAVVVDIGEVGSGF